MKIEQLSPPQGSPPYMASFVGSLVRVLQQIVGGREPKALPVYDDIASAPPADKWQNCIAIAEDGDGIGNPRVIWSNGTNWAAL